MKSTFRKLASIAFLFANLLFTGASVSCAEEPAAKQIAAGPFAIIAPVKWTEGVIVEKVPFKPIFTADELKRANERLQAAKTEKANSPRREGDEPELSAGSISLVPAYSNRPEHWAIRLPALVLAGQEFDPKTAGDDSLAPQIFIHKATEWDAALLQPGMQADEKKTMRAMRLAIDELDPGTLGFTKDDFVAAKKKLRFAGGHGFRMLAQDVMEEDLLRKGLLTYVFVGMSDDDSCQIVATIPIDISGLPADTVSAEHLGFSTARYPELTSGYRKYQRAAVAWLNENAAQATPSLAELDAMMQSLVARKWE